MESTSPASLVRKIAGRSANHASPIELQSVICMTPVELQSTLPRRERSEELATARSAGWHVSAVSASCKP